MSKGLVDFGAFSAEDLVAAQWANVDVLVTNQLKLRQRNFARNIVAVVSRKILPDNRTAVSAILMNRTLCHPAADVDDLKPLSDTLGQYLESLVTAKSCDPKLSLAENRLKTTAEFFGKACKAGVWVPDKVRDAELKRTYPSLCQACATGRCSISDPYWGDSGALNCLAASAGDIAWAELDDVQAYFQRGFDQEGFAYLCRDGSWQPLKNNKNPCVWLERPWNVIVSRRKSATAVANLTSTLMNSSVTVDRHWRGALAALLDIREALPAPLSPPMPPMDYLATAVGFREAYSQHSCNPPRHITLCTTSLTESIKCQWLSEAGSVYGVSPPIQCAKRDNTHDCMLCITEGQCDVVIADSEWLVVGKRNYSLTSLLHEATPIIEKTNTVFAYARADCHFKKMADLRRKRASFPHFDGHAFHSVLSYLAKAFNDTCKNVANNFFKEICAPGIEFYNLPNETKNHYMKNCYKEGDKLLDGEIQALRAVVEGKTDVAFISMNTYNLYKDKHIPEPWAKNIIELVPICPEENKDYCFVSWSNIGHIFASNNISSMKRQEIINVFTQLDQLFGKHHVHKQMFSMYGPFNFKLDVLFHNITKSINTDEMFRTRPYSQIPLNFESNLNSSDVCVFSDFYRSFGAKIMPSTLLSIILVTSLFLLK
ncbi:transferrin-like [Hyposmocoma kahamanoa]|uniref:transferrin-like n=1 Tax=Hyposmocoma kahamanoa TaxID=1477025 RepID=UPI000E6D958A|nr:transferrin-like [Hyposmocoma kahamanoa]